MSDKPPTPREHRSIRVAEVAARQRGNVMTAQLRACRLSKSVIGRWRDAPVLHRRHPPGLRATFFTPSPSTAEALVAHAGVRVELIGGHLQPDSMATVGAAALAALERVRPDVCVLGPCGLHPEAGITVGNVDEQPIKIAMLDRAVEVIALARATKLGAVLPFVVGPVERLTHLVVSASAEEAELARYRSRGINVIRAGVEALRA